MHDTQIVHQPAGVTVEQALLLRDLGFSVFPVPLPVPGTPDGQVGDGKRPAIEWKPFQSHRPDAAQVRQWFGRPRNIGIVTGAISNHIVIDCDSNSALRWATAHLPYTPRQTVTSKGFHLGYQSPGIPVRNRARIQTGTGKIALDVRGDGGFVIGPFSTHMSGAIYYAVADWDAPLSEVPVFDPTWLDEAPVLTPTEHRSQRTPSTAPAEERARLYLDAIPRPEIGQGSDAATLYAACRLTRGFELPPEIAVDLLEAWAGGRPGWDRQWLEQKVAHALKYGTEPLGGLR